MFQLFRLHIEFEGERAFDPGVCPMNGIYGPGNDDGIVVRFFRQRLDDPPKIDP